MAHPSINSWHHTYSAVLDGQEPAESLPSSLRQRLFRQLLANGLTLAEVAAWTRTTPYTVSRMLAMITKAV